MEILSRQTINDLRQMIAGNYNEDEVWIKDIREAGEAIRRVVVNGDDDVLCRVRPNGTLDENPVSRQKPQVKPTGNPQTTHADNPDIDIDSLSDHMTAREAHESAVERDKIHDNLDKDLLANSPSSPPKRLGPKNPRI